MTTRELFQLCLRAGRSTAGNHTQYTIETDEANVYLAFQGSMETQDWLYNFNFAVLPYKNMEHRWLAHRGFAKAWKLARDQIAADVFAVLPGKSLVICGFSHGAALAVLAHEYFRYAGKNPETHAFGCPRVLWMPPKKIKERFDNLHLHQNRADIVTKVPFALMGFRHVGNVHLYGPSGFPTPSEHYPAKYIGNLEG